MLQPKLRRAVSLVVFTFFLSFLPGSPAQASASGTSPVAGLAAQVEAEIAALWEAISAVLGDVGPRMDDNG